MSQKQSHSLEISRKLKREDKQDKQKMTTNANWKTQKIKFRILFCKEAGFNKKEDGVPEFGMEIKI